MATARHLVRIPENGQSIWRVPRPPTLPLRGVVVDQVEIQSWSDQDGAVLPGRAGRLGDTVYATPDFPESAVELLP